MTPARRKRGVNSEDQTIKVEPLKKKNRSTSAPETTFPLVVPPLTPLPMSPSSPSGMLFSYQLKPLAPPSPDKRPMQAPRAGTRGFRAPEVLLKYPYQTVAIDIWSAGIILLCILSKRYPFFNSPDDLSALAEIGALCGTKEVRETALQLGRKIQFPTEQEKTNFKELCIRLSGQREYIIPDSAYDLLAKCLELNPIKRISATECLRHPFFNEMDDTF